ncbi:MAG: IclR family transcriptional regulator [Anaerovoracaceae bacterium]|nr:IclR family transcriptional regulator [Anaerovoracaceae bacterium]
MAENPVIINSVTRALDILIYIYSRNGDVAVTEISRDLGIYKSTVFRMLATLKAKKFVTQNAETEKYSLGPELFIIGSSMNNQSELVKFIKPYSERLNKEMNEAVNVSVLSVMSNGEYQSVIIHKEESYHGLNANMEIGSRNDCYCSAVGKCLIAFSDDINLEIYKGRMKKFTDNTITTFAALKKEIEKVREQGYAVDNEEREKGLFCLAVPVIINGTTEAALSISGPETRMREDLDEKIEFITKLRDEIKNNTTRRNI